MISADIDRAYEKYIENACDFNLEQLVKSSEKLVKGFASVYGSGCCDEDLYQSGMMGLVKAIRSFDKSRNARFSAWASLCIVGEIKRYVKKEAAPHEKNVRALTRRGFAGFSEFDTRNMRERQPFQPLEERIALHDALEKLSELQKAVIKALFFCGMTQRQAAEKLGIDRHKVSHLKTQGLLALLSLLSGQPANGLK
jgi:RNA polymerase sigma-B factor